ncbi:MAG: type II toxin-antitoxin system Phd/YefM family antitoxin [Planctomycetota bacterium]|jgi:prevent-host-death family protein
MTIYDYPVVMISVSIARLKARLSEYLRLVRRGRPLTVLLRDTPIARIVPIARETGLLEVRRPREGSPSIQEVPLPEPLGLHLDVVDLLLEERRVDR